MDKQNIDLSNVTLIGHIKDDWLKKEVTFIENPQLNKTFNGKAIKMPQGAAGEYAKYACNFYKGCSNSCTYCFNKRWKWGDVPKLKACFKDENHALEVFEKELKANLPELQKHGLFFSFTTDPMLPETVELTKEAMMITSWYNVPVKILTKTVPEHFGIYGNTVYFGIATTRKDIAFGFTLTGHDELEPHASTNAERIEAMRKLHEAGFKTWGSLEPLIDFSSAVDMIVHTMGFCDLYKIGLLSRKKYNPKMLKTFVGFVCAMRLKNKDLIKIYFKDSLLAQAGIDRAELPENCVSRDYNMFEL